MRTRVRTLGLDGRWPSFVATIAITSVACLLMLLTGAASADARWADISDHEWMADYGVTAEQVASVAAGYEDGTFRPELPVSRGHFAKMVVEGLALGTAEPAVATFADVPADAALWAWIEGAVASGAIRGYGDGTFRPCLPVTRQQAGSILGLCLAARELSATGRIAGDGVMYESLDEWHAAEGAGVLTVFADAGQVSAAHAPALAYLAYRGAVRGSVWSDGVYLDPLTGLSRAQAVALVIRVAGVEVSPQRSINPFVSTGWLHENLGVEGLAVLDLRSAADHATAHIPGSISAPFGGDSGWARPADGLILELPTEADLLQTIGDCGLTEHSRVVLVGGTSSAGRPLVDATRVALTLSHAGIRDVAILQGGHAAWADEGRAVTKDPALPAARTYNAPSSSGLFVSTEYVEQHVGSATIVDTRSVDIYLGEAADALAPQLGHIPTARSLPAQWLWQTDGTYVASDLAAQMAAGVIGTDKDQEVIVYCTSGGTASAWWFVLSQVLGYRDVKLYDGSAQAWAKDHEMVVATSDE